MKKPTAILLLAAVVAFVPIQTQQPIIHAQEDPTIPRLSDAQLLEIVSQPHYLPASYRDTAKGSSHTESTSIMVDGMREVWPLLGDRLETITRRYGWAQYIGAEYNTCQPDRAISLINIDVSQLESAETARAFIDDLAVRTYFEALFLEITDSTVVHGWTMTGMNTENGDCFGKEDIYSLVFEHWGLLFSLDVYAQTGTDPALPLDMINQIAVQIVQMVDTLYSSGFPATPMPNPSVTSLTASLTLDTLDRVMSTSDEISLPAGKYLPNQTVSRIFTLNDMVVSYRSLNLTRLADALQQVGTAHGLLGQSVRLWEPIESCPSIIGISIEIDIALFVNANGPAGYMADSGFQQAWIDTGLISQFVPQSDGSMLVYGALPNHHCGRAKIIERMIPLDRLLITTAITTYQEVPDADALEIVDAIETLALWKIKLTAIE